MRKTASTMVIPLFRRSVLVEDEAVEGESIELLADGQRVSYRVVPEARPATPLYYAVLDSEGVPWAEACLYILDRAETYVDPEVQTLAYLAADLSRYRDFCDSSEIDWLVFPLKEKLRPIHRYRVYLSLLIASGEIDNFTGSRMIGSVISFYKDIIDKGYFSPENPPWKESISHIFRTDNQGNTQGYRVNKKDVNITRIKNDNPYNNGINDGGNLKPLTSIEQTVLFKSLNKLGNTELKLMHLAALFSGGRTQTICTLRAKNFMRPPEELGSIINIACGGTSGINTKKRKQRKLAIPNEVYERIYIYSKSARYKDRAKKAIGGFNPNQYIFLSSHGNPFYDAREDLSEAVAHRGIRYKRVGQSLRQIIKESVIPLMRESLEDKYFTYSFHDLRATFGVNFLNSQPKDADGNIEDVTKSINDLRDLLWHESSETTLRYIRYKPSENKARKQDEAFAAHLEKIIEISFGN